MFASAGTGAASTCYASSRYAHARYLDRSRPHPPNETPACRRTRADAGRGRSPMLGRNVAARLDQAMGRQPPRWPGLPELLRGVSARLVQLGLVRKQMSYTEHGSVGFRRLRLVLHGNASLSSQSQDLQITEAKRKLKRWNIVLHIQFGLFMFSNANVIIGGVIGRAVWQGLSMLFMVLSIVSAGIANHKVTKWETILKNLQRLSSTLPSAS